MKIEKINTIITPRTIGVALVVAVLVGGAYFIGRQQGNTQNNTEKLVTVADKYKKQLPALEEAVKKNSSDSKARREYAVALYAAGDLDKAKEQYQTEIRMNNSNAITYNNLGNIHRQQGKYDVAIKMYEESLNIDEKNVQTYLNLGHLFANTLNKPDEAIRVFTEGLNKNPNNETIQTQLAVVYERNGKVDQAKQTYQEILKYEPNNTTAQEALQRLEKTK